MNIDWDSQILALLVSFIAVGLKGFQHKNVIGNNLKLVAVTSYAMAVADVTLVGLISSKGWVLTLAIGTGSTIGMLLAIVAHNKFVGSK